MTRHGPACQYLSQNHSFELVIRFGKLLARGWFPAVLVRNPVTVYTFCATQSIVTIVLAKKKRWSTKHLTKLCQSAMHHENNPLRLQCLKGHEETCVNTLRTKQRPRKFFIIACIPGIGAYCNHKAGKYKHTSVTWVLQQKYSFCPFLPRVCLKETP